MEPQILEPYDFLVKFLMIGDTSVGKTNLVSRFICDDFSEHQNPTLGVDFMTKVIEVHGKKIRAQIWDTAGQEKYKSITKSYYVNSKIALVVFDLTEEKTFKSVDRWIKDLREVTGKKVEIALIGNKLDLHEYRQVSYEAGKEKAKQLNTEYFETSAKTGENVVTPFNTLLSAVFERYYADEVVSSDDDNHKNGGTISLTPNRDKKKEEEKQSGCSC